MLRPPPASLPLALLLACYTPGDPGLDPGTGDPMAQTLVSILTVNALAAGAQVVMPHGLATDAGAVAPNAVLANRATPIKVVSVDATNVTFLNTDTQAAHTAKFRVWREYSTTADAAGLAAFLGQEADPGQGSVPSLSFPHDGGTHYLRVLSSAAGPAAAEQGDTLRVVGELGGAADADNAGGIGGTVSVTAGAGGAGSAAQAAGHGGTLQIAAGAGGFDGGGGGGVGGDLAVTAGATTQTNADGGNVFIGGGAAGPGTGRTGYARINGKLALQPSAVQNIANTAAQVTPNASIVRLNNTTGGALVLGNAPTILDGQVDGQILVLRNRSGAGGTLQFQGEGSLPGSNLLLGAATRTLGAKGELVLEWDATEGSWCEVAFVAALQ
jgi:hypothetical protein